MKPLLIVDGYNVIGAWSMVQKKGWTMDESRDQLAHLLQDYAGYSGEEVVLVFDGYQSDRPMSTEDRLGPILQVFTKHGETADSYIERYVAQLPKYRYVRVATSDGLEQSQVLSTGAVRMTSRELLRELVSVRSQGLVSHQKDAGIQRRPISDHLSKDTLQVLEKLRRRNEPPEPTPVKAQPAAPNPKPASPAAPAQPLLSGKAAAKAKASPAKLPPRGNVSKVTTSRSSGKNPAAAGKNQSKHKR